MLKQSKNNDENTCLFDKKNACSKIKKQFETSWNVYIAVPSVYILNDMSVCGIYIRLWNSCIFFPLADPTYLWNGWMFFFCSEFKGLINIAKDMLIECIRVRVGSVNV